MPREDEFTEWQFGWSRRNDQWWVDKFRAGDLDGKTYGDSLAFRTQKDAIRVCDAMNQAYLAGIAYGMSNVQMCLKCHNVIPGMPMWIFVDGKPLPVETKDIHVFCVECGKNGGNGMKSAEYQELVDKFPTK